MSFEEDESYYDFELKFRPQFYWLCDDEGKLLVDFIGRFENLQEDFNTICGKIGLEDIIFPKVNVSRKNKEYKSYYDDETKDIVRVHLEKILNILDTSSNY